jgi:hypothetical protein
MVQVVKETTSEYGYFVQTLLTMVTKRMGKEYTASIYKVMKNNSLELDSLVLLKEGKSFAPNIYLQPYYEAYKQGVGLNELTERLCRIYEESNTPIVNSDFDYSFEMMKDHIIYRLISYDRNQKLLEQVPHLNFMDLAITYHCLVRDDKDGIGTIRITNNHMKMWNKGVKEIHECAVANTQRLFPAVINSMEEVICGMLTEEGDHTLISSALLEEHKGKPSDMYILTNEKGINGAACILYPEVLGGFARNLDSDLYIFPSSIHEVILVPAVNLDTSRQYAGMVKEINDTQVAPEEVLSDHIYYYSRKSGLRMVE